MGSITASVTRGPLGVPCQRGRWRAGAGGGDRHRPGRAAAGGMGSRWRAPMPRRRWSSGCASSRAVSGQRHRRRHGRCSGQRAGRRGVPGVQHLVRPAPGMAGRVLPPGPPECSAPGRAFIIECFAPGLVRFGRGQGVQTLEAAEDVVTVELSCNDAAQQRSPFRSSRWTGTGCGWDPWPSATRGPVGWACGRSGRPSAHREFKRLDSAAVRLGQWRLSLGLPPA
jgi:hypothetical protein